MVRVVGTCGALKDQTSWDQMHRAKTSRYHVLFIGAEKRRLNELEAGESAFHMNISDGSCTGPCVLYMRR